METYDIIVIGGGPAGMTAALYALRAEKKVLIIEGTGFGGQIVYTNSVENFPGSKVMSGMEFADALLEQVMSLGGEVELDTVISIKDGEIKTVITESREFSAKAVIIASGVKHRRLGAKGEEELIGRGVSFCAVCDGAFYKGKTVAVIGGGNTALEDAAYLADIADKVYLIHRRNEFRAEPRVVREVEKRANIEKILGRTVSEFINEDGVLSALRISDVNSGEEAVLEGVSGAFVAVGQIPQNEIFRDLIELDEYGYIKSGEDAKTNTDGIFAAGDCRCKKVRQLTTAVGDGSVAALAACDYLLK